MTPQELANPAISPGPDKFFATDAAGQKLWRSISEAAAFAFNVEPRFQNRRTSEWFVVYIADREDDGSVAEPFLKIDPTAVPPGYAEPVLKNYRTGAWHRVYISDRDDAGLPVEMYLKIEETPVS